jgi:SAM-dependent methyltransferase
MDQAHLLELKQKEDDYWWHVNKRRLVQRLVSQYQDPSSRILEIGCGGGLTSRLFAEEGYWVVASDLSFQAAQFVSGHPQMCPILFDANTGGWPFQSSSFDVILMLDVLEHIEDEVVCLQEARRVLRDNGILILTVPAHQYLFSSWDHIVGHKRRYSKRTLRFSIHKAGFFARVLSHSNAISFFPALVLRGLDRLCHRSLSQAEFPPVHALLNSFLKLWGRLEANLILSVGVPFGLSFVAVLSKDSK